MPGVEIKGAAATCGHVNSGSTTIFAEGKGITRVGVDTAGGLINGPGSLTVYAEGYNVSLPGDAIVGHGKGAHAGPKTTNPAITVFAY